MKVFLYTKNYIREEIASKNDTIFLFGDNTYDRTISKHIPRVTQAVIRGLPNAIGIDTKKTRYTDDKAYLSDNDYNNFVSHVDTQIELAKSFGKDIAIPSGGIGTGKAFLKEKAPKCFEYLNYKLKELLGK